MEARNWGSRWRREGYERPIDWLIGVVAARGIAAGVEPARWKGKTAARGGSLAHDVSNLPGVGRHLGSQPRAKTSTTIMRAPQRGHGQDATRGASGATSGCGSAGRRVGAEQRAGFCDVLGAA